MLVWGVLGRLVLFLLVLLVLDFRKGGQAASSIEFVIVLVLETVIPLYCIWIKD